MTAAQAGPGLRTSKYMPLQVAKNIVLAGVGSLSLMDNTLCASADPDNFLVPHDAKHQAR